MITTLIPCYRKDELTAEIAKLAARAAKLGCDAPTLIFGASKVIKIGRNGFGEDMFCDHIEATVSGSAPKLAGWEFVGTISRVEDTGATLLKSVPGATIPAYYRDANPEHCDHCGINRFRKDTFIVAKDGEFKQVGRSCLKDFLGHHNPEAIAQYCSLLAGFNIKDYSDIDEEDIGRGGRIVWSVETLNFLAVAHAAIRQYGYRKADADFPTKVMIGNHYWSKRDDDRIAVEDSDRDAAAAAQAWISARTGSEFNLNAAAFAAAEFITEKAFGYLAAAMMMFMRERDEVAARATASESINEEPIAAPGTKVKVLGTIINVHRYQNDFGMKSIYTIRTGDNKIIKLFTTNNGFDAGSQITISGTIKGQEVESFAKSPYVGKMVNYFNPRARIA